MRRIKYYEKSFLNIFPNFHADVPLFYDFFDCKYFVVDR